MIFSFSPRSGGGFGRRFRRRSVVGTQRPDLFGEAGHHFGKPRRFGGRNPLDGETLRIDPQILQDDADGGGAAQGFDITVQVMAFTEVSAHDDDAVGSLAQGTHHQVRMDHPRAHHPDGAHVGRVLQPGDAGEVAAGIGAPVAQKTDDRRFEVVGHDAVPFWIWKKLKKMTKIVND
jgi:hypothetical protein